MAKPRYLLLPSRDPAGANFDICLSKYIHTLHLRSFLQQQKADALHPECPTAQRSAAKLKTQIIQR